MFGVILWRNASTSQALVWCEDQGDLAFIESDTVISGAHSGLGPGDLVLCDIVLRDDLRQVRRADLVGAGLYAGLGESLLAQAVA